jgi:hypothetical protein
MDLEALMTAASLRLSPRKRDVNLTSAPAGRHNLIDRKTVTNGFDTTDRGEQRGQLLLGNSKNFDVNVLRGASTQAVSHPSPDHQRAAASRGDGLCNAPCGVE